MKSNTPRLEVSNNSTSIFNSCQKKYFWTYVQGLKPIRKSSALSLGGIIHEAFDLYYRGTSLGDTSKFIHDTMDSQIANAKPEEIEDLTIVKHILLGMWSFHPFKLSDWTSIKPEMEFRVKIPGTRGIVFVGKIDGLVTDQSGSMWVRELKTTSQPFSQFELRSRQSPQGSGYIWAMRQLGYPVQGIIYDYIKKPLLRKGVSENAISYCQRIFTDYGQRPDNYFKRHPSYRTAEEIRLFEQDLKKVAYDIRQRSHDNNWHRNADQCWNYNSECPYLKICFKENPDPLTLSIYFDQKNTNYKGATNVRGTNTGGSIIGSGVGGATPSVTV